MDEQRKLFMISFSSSDSGECHPLPTRGIPPRPPDGGARARPFRPHICGDSATEGVDQGSDEAFVTSESTDLDSQTGPCEAHVEEGHSTSAMFCYELERHRSLRLTGIHNRFRLTRDGECLYQTSVKGDGPAIMRVYTGEGDCVVGAVVVEDDTASFAVRRNSESGATVAAITYRRIDVHSPLPRLTEVKLIHNSEIREVLVNKTPVRNAVGRWTLDFHQKDVVFSVKNAILVDKNQTEIYSMAKVGRDKMVVRTNEVLDTLTLFGIGVSSFLCKLT